MPAGDPPDPHVERLGAYRAKRRSGRTPEPLDPGVEDAGRRFVVQRHLARQLHYDLRLERGGVLMSWALPRGVPLRAGERALAVHVEDHPLAYAGFEGEIPSGEYGAGRVEIWDRGVYEIVKERADGTLTVVLDGGRLQGEWALVPARLDGNERNWLIVRAAKNVPERQHVELAPMLSRSSDEIPTGADWRFEIKWDGIRALARVHGAGVELVSRNAISLDDRFPSLLRAIPRAVRSSDCVIDGEICALDEDGSPSFSLLQRGGGTTALMAFDLLELDGRDVTREPWSERRRLLAELLDDEVDVVRLSRAFEDGAALLAAVRERALEGIMAKRVDSPYRCGTRSDDWRKIKLRQRETVRIAGYTRGKGGRSALGALVLADDTLAWVGNCGSGIGDREIEELLAALEPLRRGTAPLTGDARPRGVAAAGITWVEPELSCTVSFAERTVNGRLRAPVFERLERPARVVKLTNRDKVFFPDEHITKGDLLDYYRAIAPAMVPHLRGRPVTMVRFPDGITGKSFFQKQRPSHTPDWIASATLASRPDGGGRVIAYPLVDDLDGLLWMVNAGCIDMHVTQARAASFSSPDFLLFDLDPAAGCSLQDVAQVALLVRDALAIFGLTGYAKTSSVDGMHVIAPIARGHGYDEARNLVRLIAAALERAHPGLVTTEWAKERRRGVLIDSNQVGYGRTISAAYSVRPRPGAPVSLPVTWDEVEAGLGVELSMESALDRVERHGDLLAPLLEPGPPLPDGLGVSRER